ncbi:glycosyltransferase [Pseudonocardia acidicola]|uniref:glycosyltransferase n=1 Tax=Pseudonocardia acidicola TaxID=2724939 RepID=UPI00308410EE
MVSAPLLGHLLPMLPLTRALHAAGHEVRVAAGGDALSADTAGLGVIDVAPGFRFGRVATRTVLAHPRAARAELAGESGTRTIGLLFGAINEELADTLVTVVERWRPDRVIYEPLAVAGALAAARHRVPAVLLENSLLDGPELVRATLRTRLFRRALRRHGFDEELPDPATAITIAPPSLVGDRAGRPMRAVPEDGTGTGPGRPAEPGTPPRIVVSRSTVDLPGPGDPMPAVLAAASGVDAEIVLVGPAPRIGRRSLPDNVRTVEQVPLTAVLAGAAALVHRGGAGTVLGALGAGIPQLAVPGPGERRHNAELVAHRGAGLAVPAREITADVLNRLVADPGYAAAAREVRDEMAAMPDPAELVGPITATPG